MLLCVDFVFTTPLGAMLGAAATSVGGARSATADCILKDYTVSGDNSDICLHSARPCAVLMLCGRRNSAAAWTDESNIAFVVMTVSPMETKSATYP